MTPEAIERAARADRDAQPLTETDLKRMRRTPQAKIIRRALDLTQEEFAARLTNPMHRPPRRFRWPAYGNGTVRPRRFAASVSKSGQARSSDCWEPNGAGKTTTLECILGLRQPDGGSIQIDGLDLGTHATQAKLLVGAQLQAATLQDKITPRQAWIFSVRSTLSHLPAMNSSAFRSGGQSRRPLRYTFRRAAATVVSGAGVINRPTSAGARRAHGRSRSASPPQVAHADSRDAIGGQDGPPQHSRSPGSRSIMRSDRYYGWRANRRGRAAGRIDRPLAIAGAADRANRPASGEHRRGCAARSNRGCYGDRGWILETRAPNRVLAELVRRVDEAGAELLEVELRRPSLEDVFIELTGRPWSGGRIAGRSFMTALPN
jgi:hypothetical protein